jgi:WD40 repeat protein
MYYKVDLQPDEELTTACYSGNGSNWAVGTSFGSVILGATKRGLFREPDGFISTRIDGLMRDQTYGVTSIQLSDFTPDGKMLVSFANGEVKLWKSFIPGDRKPKYEQQSKDEGSRKGKRNSRREKVFDIAELGITKFDIHDLFDMFKDPHGHGDELEDEQIGAVELYGVSNPNSNYFV